MKQEEKVKSGNKMLGQIRVNLIGHLKRVLQSMHGGRADQFGRKNIDQTIRRKKSFVCHQFSYMIIDMTERVQKEEEEEPVKVMICLEEQMNVGAAS